MSAETTYPKPLSKTGESNDDSRGIIGSGLAKAYGGRLVLNQASFHLRPAEVVGFLGSNGAGKTTLFSIVAGLLRPDQGQVLIDGTDVTSLPIYQRARLGLGYLPQESSIFRGMSTEDNLLAVLEFFIAKKSEQLKVSQSILKEYRLEKVRKTKASLLSGGERRRLEMARAVAINPHYLLLDEPFAGVDPLAVADLRQMIYHLKLKGIGVLITDHNVRETLQSVDRAYIIHAGQILTQGTPEQIYANPSVRDVYLGQDFRP